MTRTLIVAPAWIGDMVMAQSLVSALKRREPDVSIDLLAPPWTSGLGQRMPGVSRTIEIGIAHRKFDPVKRIKFGRTLRNDGYRRAIVLPGSWKSGIVPFTASIPERRGYIGEFRHALLNDVRRLDEKRVPRTVDRFVALAAPRGEAAPETAAPVLTVDRQRVAELAERLGLARDRRPVVALCPGAEFGPAKRWPTRHFAALADSLAAAGFQTWIFGSSRDGPFAEEIIGATRKLPAPVNLVGRTSLLDALDLLSLADNVVTNDSGLMHVAAAIGRPVVALYGSSTPEMTPPLGCEVRIVERTLPCRPCFQRECPLGHLNCLNLITPAEIADIVAAQVERVA